MKERPVVVCWVVEITVLLLFTRACQFEVPAGIGAILMFFALSVKAPLSRMDCPGAVSRAVQKTVLEV
jgi:hypothetical protein